MTDYEKQVLIKYANLRIKEAALKEFENWDAKYGISAGINGAQTWLNKKLDTKNSGLFGKITKGTTNFLLNDVLLGIANDAYRAAKLAPRTLLGGIDAARGKLSGKDYLGYMGDSLAGGAWTALNLAGAGVLGTGVKAGTKAIGRKALTQFAPRAEKVLARNLKANARKLTNEAQNAAVNTLGIDASRVAKRKAVQGAKLTDTQAEDLAKQFADIRNPYVKEQAFKSLPKEVQSKVYNTLSPEMQARNIGLLSRVEAEAAVKNLPKEQQFNAIWNMPAEKQYGMLSSMVNPIALWRNTKNHWKNYTLAKDLGLNTWDKTRLLGKAHLYGYMPLAITPSLLSLPLGMAGQDWAVDAANKLDNTIGYNAHKRYGTLGARAIENVNETDVRDLAKWEGFNAAALNKIFTRDNNGELKFNNSNINALAKQLFEANPDLADSEADLALNLKALFSAQHRPSNQSGFLFDKFIQRFLSDSSRVNTRTEEDRARFRKALKDILS